MLQIRRILFPTDFSATARQALDHALLLAELHEAELHLLHAVVLHDDDLRDAGHDFPEPKEILEHLFGLAKGRLARLTADHGSKTFALKEVTRRGFSVAEVILEYAGDTEADLIVMGTHGHRGPSRWFLGSVAERVVRQAHCPVLTLRHQPDARKLEGFRRLLVPIDFSEHSREALLWARELASAYGSGLELLHVVEEPAYPYFYAPIGGLAAAQHYEEVHARAEEALRKLAREVLAPAAEFEISVASGRPSGAIASHAAESGCDLIVMSTHGLSGLDRLLLGSTTEGVVRTAACPVLTVKAYGRSLLPESVAAGGASAD